MRKKKEMATRKPFHYLKNGTPIPTEQYIYLFSKAQHKRGKKIYKAQKRRQKRGRK